MTGFQAIGAGFPVQQRVAVALADLVVLEALFLEHFVIFRKFLNYPLRHKGNIAGAHAVLRIGPSGSVLEGRISQSDFLGALSHLLGKL